MYMTIQESGDFITIQMTEIGHERVVINPCIIILDQDSPQARPLAALFTLWTQLKEMGGKDNAGSQKQGSSIASDFCHFQSCSLRCL